MESRGHRRSQSSSGKELTSKISNNEQTLPVRHEVGIVQEKCKINYFWSKQIRLQFVIESFEIIQCNVKLK